MCHFLTQKRNLYATDLTVPPPGHPPRESRSSRIVYPLRGLPCVYLRPTMRVLPLSHAGVIAINRPLAQPLHPFVGVLRGRAFQRREDEHDGFCKVVKIG
jgi:hypothetical protein